MTNEAALVPETVSVMITVALASEVDREWLEKIWSQARHPQRAGFVTAELVER